MIYKVLLLEDNEMDATLMEQYLQRSEYNFEVKWVQSGEAYEKAVRTFEPDVIIADYRLKNYTGLDAIHFKNVECEEVPLVIVSGTVGEEKAVEMIKEGATDFLIKNNTSNRLAQTIIRAIKEAIEREKRKNTEFELKKSEKRFRMLFEHSLDGIIIGNPEDEGNIITANHAACKMLGYTDGELRGKALGDFVNIDNKKVIEGIEKRDNSGKFRGEIYLKQKNGSLLAVEVSSRVLELKSGEKRSYYIFRDISERMEAEQKIQESLKEKETLLTEIHHRVKNNLAVISGIMELQAMESDNKELQAKMFDSQSRIKSIAITHELLYEEQNFSNIDYGANIKKLVNSIAKTMNTDVDFNFNLDKLRININQALPCSLIINEIVTNALRHAFNGDQKPVVEIFLKNEKNKIHLRVSDNGKGLPGDFDLKKPKTIGFKLISILAKQLDGKVKINSNSGTEFHLKFRKKQKKGTGSSIIENNGTS